MPGLPELAGRTSSRGILACRVTLHQVIGVTGATGEVGGRVARLLSDRGAPQRLIVRDTARAPKLPHVEVAAFGGYDDLEGMERAFKDQETLLLVSAREAADRVDQHKLAVDAAVAADVQHIVYLSFIGAAPDATFSYARHHFETEAYIRSSGIPFTLSRQNLYMDLLPFLGGEEGVIRGPAGNGRVVPVLRDDVAAAVTVMLTEADHTGKIYELTGPDALTLLQVADELTRATGKVVRYENETLEEAQSSRAKYGAPDWEVEGWITTYTAVAAGEMDVITDDVKMLTGRDPVGVRAFLSAV